MKNIINQWTETSNLELHFEKYDSLFILGRNEYSLKLAKYLKIDAFVDDYYDLPDWENYKVIKLVDLPENCCVINCSLSISPVTVQKKLSLIDKNKKIEFFHCSQLWRNPEPFVDLPIPEFIIETRNDFVINSNQYEKVYSILEDDESKLVFMNMLSYRLTGDPCFMNEYIIRVHEQYFESFFNLDPGEVFADCGGFDGDTTELFSNLIDNKHRKIYFFEPSDFNLSNAKKRLQNIENIVYIPKGLSDKKEELFFDDNQGSNSKFVSNGTKKIQVTTLDEEIQEKITFIKIDIEGYELKALNGAKNHIINDFPKIACAVYHNSKDIHEIYNYIMSLRNDYKIYLKHYTEGWSETIMYFIPALSQ